MEQNKSSSPDCLSDKEFLDLIYQQYSQFVYLQATRYCYTKEQIDDIVQQTWLSLCSKSEVLRTLSSPALLSYLSTTVRNEIRMLHRKQRIETIPIEFIDQLSDDCMNSFDNYFDEFLQKEQFYKLWDCVDPGSRELLERKYMLYEDDSDIAKKLGVKESSIRMYLTRARRNAFRVFKSKHNNG